MGNAWQERMQLAGMGLLVSLWVLLGWITATIGELENEGSDHVGPPFGVQRQNRR